MTKSPFPPVTEPTNQDRVSRIEELLPHYEQHQSLARDETLQDLMTDLRHWAHAHGLDFEQHIRMSEDNFKSELADECPMDSTATVSTGPKTT